MMRNATLSLLAVCAGATAAHAQTGPYQRAFGAGTESTCFQRIYDARHLTANPRQRARSVVIAFRPLREPINGKRERSTAQRFELAFGVLLKGDTELYVKPAYCRTSGDGFDCGLESDGGTLRITVEQSGALRVATQEIRFEGAKRFVELGARVSDDGVFIVPRADAAACSAVRQGAS